MSRPMSFMKMKRLSLYEEDPPVKKIKKYKTKEEKEIKKTFENIARKLLSSAVEEIRTDVETRLRDVITRTNSEIRHEVSTIENTFSSRLLSLETKVNTLGNRIEENHSEHAKKLDLLTHEISNFNTQTAQHFETERSKRLVTAKKLQEKFEQQIETLQNNISTTRHDNTASVNALNEDLRLQVKEIVGIKEKVDEILIKQLGYLPRSGVVGGTSSMNHGLDSGIILDNISNRIQKLEQAMAEDADMFNSFTMEKGGSPLRISNNKKSLNRIRRIEEHIYELESQIKENETDIDQIKQSVVRQLRSRSASPTRDRHSDSSNPSDIKEIEKKLKKLADSTTRACKSLSSGLTDVQQATLSLYSWTDRVHDNFEVIAQKLNLPPNLCPRAKLSTNGGRSKGFTTLADF